MQNLKRLIYSTIISALLSGLANAAPVTDDALRGEITDIKRSSSSDFAQIAGYSKLLQNPDLTDEQTALVLRYRASTRSGNGDDKIGAVEDYARIRDNYPNSSHYDHAATQYAYTYGQIYHMTKRLLSAKVVDEDVIGDVWGLGYWDQAINLISERNTKIITDTPLLRDMYEVGYLCEIDGSGTTPRFTYNLNNKQYRLDFCLHSQPLKYQSSQSHPHDTFGKAITDLYAKAAEEKG